MTPDALEQRLKAYGISCRVRNNEVVVERCANCGNEKWNLEINVVTGVFHCWACGDGGRADVAVKKLTGIQIHIEVNKDREWTPTIQRSPPVEFLGGSTLDNDGANQYLVERGLNTVDQRVYETKVAKENPQDAMWKSRAILPLNEYWTQKTVGYMGRSFIGAVPKYYAWWEKNKKQIVGYRRNSDLHVIVEGLFDGIKVHKAGFNAVVLTGIMGPEIEEWAARVPTGHNVAVCLDGSASAEARKLYWRIWPIHPTTMLLKLPVDLDPGQLDPVVLETFIRRARDSSEKGVG